MAGVNHWYVITEDLYGAHIFKWRTCPEDAMKNGKHFCGYDHAGKHLSKIFSPDLADPNRESTLELKPPITRENSEVNHDQSDGS